MHFNITWVWFVINLSSHKDGQSLAILKPTIFWCPKMVMMNEIIIDDAYVVPHTAILFFLN